MTPLPIPMDVLWFMLACSLTFMVTCFVCRIHRDNKHRRSR